MSAKKLITAYSHGRTVVADSHGTGPPATHASGLPGASSERQSPGHALPHHAASRRYSLSRALTRLIGGEKIDGLEGEVSAEISRRMGRGSPAGVESGGMWIPLDAPVERRSLTTSTGSGSVVSPDLGVIVDVLRSRLCTARLGARTLTDLHGTPFLPKRTAAASLGWFSEGSAAPASNQTITQQVQFTPHSTGVYTDFSRWARDLMVPDVETTILEDAMLGLAVAIDAAALTGPGASYQPTGILANGSIPVVAFGTNGDYPSNDLLVAMLETLANNNGLDGYSLGFATSASGEAALRTKFRNGTGSKALLDGVDFVLGCRFASSTNVPNNLTKGSGTGLSAAILGSWASLTIGLWPLYVVINPYLQSTQGVTRVTWYQDVDTQVRQANQFVIAKDMQTP